MCVCVYGRGVHACTSAHVSVIRFEISNRMKHQAVKDWKIQQRRVCRVGRGWSRRNGCVDNYWGSTLVRARWAELPGDLYQQRFLAVKRQRLQEIQAITNSFPKQRDWVQRSTARGQAVWVLCEVNVHIHIMYRHRDRLHSWVRVVFFSFLKSPW